MRPSIGSASLRKRTSLIVYAVPSDGPQPDAVLLTHPAVLAWAFAARPAVEGSDIYRESKRALIG